MTAEVQEQLRAEMCSYCGEPTGAFAAPRADGRNPIGMCSNCHTGPETFSQMGVHVEDYEEDYEDEENDERPTCVCGGQDFEATSTSTWHGSDQENDVSEASFSGESLLSPDYVLCVDCRRDVTARIDWDVA